ncbi:oxidoreductase [Streptosporangium nondiastaticum]|uniref:Oxidoreductase n=1 Tax=Streptosporangium nondiastaticum TaxID=35764 RepID=A0A9X7JJL2_9ACTN|nr:Gfo/Idh/MocA family oxidoreductase [Streptosporangium nondiastaticum]PSJ24948.1 oxidoreductase [Streptosporangium nondiastaticum]
MTFTDKTPGEGSARPADREPLRLAVVGAGWVARQVWLPLLEAHPAFRVDAVVDDDPAAARSAVPRSGHARVLRRPEELSPDSVDAAVIALPNHLHLPVARALVERDVPVFVEKPVFRTLFEAQALALDHLARGSIGDLTLYSWSAARHRTDVCRLAELLPTLGTIRNLGLSWIRATGIPQRTGWFVDRRLSGGGALLDLGWHLLDVGLHLLGWPRVVRAAGTMSADWMERGDATADWRPRPQDGPAARPVEPVEDTARGFLVTDTGVGISLETRWASHQALDVTTITVEGTEGVATLRGTFGFSPHRLPRSSLTVLRMGREESIALPDEPVGIEYERQVDELARRLGGPRGGRPASGLGEGSMAEVTILASCIDHIYSAAGRTLREVS